MKLPMTVYDRDAYWEEYTGVGDGLVLQNRTKQDFDHDVYMTYDEWKTVWENTTKVSAYWLRQFLLECTLDFLENNGHTFTDVYTFFPLECDYKVGEIILHLYLDQFTYTKKLNQVLQLLKERQREDS